METALQLSPGQLHLVIAPPALGHQLTNTFIVRLALAGQVRVLDGGNHFEAHHIARLLRRRTSELYAALGRIQVQRAFTCHQMLAMLIHSSTSPEPLLVLDMLSTFYDESAPQMERMRLLEHSLGQLRRLSSIAPVAVSVPPSPPAHRAGPGSPAPSAECASFLERLEAAADQVWRFEIPAAQVQPRLF